MPGAGAPLAVATTELRLTSHSVRRASAAFGGMPSGTTGEASSPSARQRSSRRPNAQPTNTSSGRHSESASAWRKPASTPAAQPTCHVSHYSAVLSRVILDTEFILDRWLR